MTVEEAADYLGIEIACEVPIKFMGKLLCKLK
jgi:hypothetical protein